MAIIAIFLGSVLLSFQVIEYYKPGIFPLLFLFGPLLYLYVKSLAIENFNLKRKDLAHLIPLVIISIHRSVAGPASISNIPDHNTPQYIYNKIYYTLLVLLYLIYWIFSIKLLLAHHRKIPYQFSNYTSKNSLRWLTFVLSLFLVFFIDEINTEIMQYLISNKPYLNPDYSLQMMADDMKISRQKLSEVINFP